MVYLVNTERRYIRTATLYDAPLILEKCREFYKGTAYAGKVGFSSEKVRLTIDVIIKNPEIGTILLHLDDDGNPTGFLMAMAVEPSFGRLKVAAEIAWGIDSNSPARAAVRLVEAYEAWARSHGLSVVTTGLLGHLNDSGLARFYERKGYELVEQFFIKVL